MEQIALPSRARLTWLVGPPGSGKSTFGARAHGFERVVELTSMLGPLVNGPRIRKGLLDANGRLVSLIRAVERHPDNRALPPLLIVAGLVPEDVLFPIGEDESVWLLLPDRERWMRQLRTRPVDGGSSGQYDDYAYSEAWYERFGGWVERPGVHRIEVPFDAGLIGKVVG